MAGFFFHRLHGLTYLVEICLTYCYVTNSPISVFDSFLTKNNGVNSITYSNLKVKKFQKNQIKTYELKLSQAIKNQIVNFFFLSKFK